MRVRFWALIAMLVLAVLAIGLAGCNADPAAGGTANTPVPSKTLRPTFTATVPQPTLTPSPTAGQAGTESNGQPAAPAQSTNATTEPTATPVPPTAEPSPTPEAAAFTVTSASINVRGGPGTTFPVLGRLTQGQSFPISGKSDNGDWWQFDYNGKPGWVIASNVTANGTDAVEVAQNIPQPPTAAPRPTARPAAPKPAQPAQPKPQPQVASKYATTKSELRPNTNAIVSVWCFVINRSNNGLNAGTMRVLQGGAVVKEQPFSAIMARGDSGYSSEYLYSDGCKVEVPASDGTYTAYLIEGGNQISDAFNFTVSGSTNRIAIIEWKER